MLLIASIFQKCEPLKRCNPSLVCNAHPSFLQNTPPTHYLLYDYFVNKVIPSIGNLKIALMAQQSNVIYLSCKDFLSLESRKLQMISLIVGRSIVFQLSLQNSSSFTPIIQECSLFIATHIVMYMHVGKWI